MGRWDFFEGKVLHVIGEKVVERLTLSHFMIDSNFTSQF